MIPFYHQRGPVHTEDLIRPAMSTIGRIGTPTQRAKGDRAAAHAALLGCVAVLFVIFQTPLIRSNACTSTHEADGSAGLSNPRRTLATSPACVTERKRPSMCLPAGGPPLETVGQQTFVKPSHRRR